MRLRSAFVTKTTDLSFRKLQSLVVHLNFKEALIFPPGAAQRSFHAKYFISDSVEDTSRNGYSRNARNKWQEHDTEHNRPAGVE